MIYFYYYSNKNKQESQTSEGLICLKKENISFKYIYIIYKTMNFNKT